MKKLRKRGDFVEIEDAQLKIEKSLDEYASEIGISRTKLSEIIDEWNRLDNVSFVDKYNEIVKNKGNSGDGYLKGKRMNKYLK